MLELTWQAWVVIATTISVFTLALKTKLPTHLIFLTAIVLLVVCGILTPAEAIDGYDNTSVITAAVLFVVAAGLEKAGLMHWLVEHCIKTPSTHIAGIMRIMFPSAIMSSFMSNTSVVALLINVVRIWGKKSPIKASQLLIPLSYAAGAGGALTLIGSPSTLIIAGLYADETGDTMGIFSPFWPALICLVVCVLTVVVMRNLLPKRDVVKDRDLMMGDSVMTITIPPTSPLVGYTIEESTMMQYGGCKLVEQVHFDGERHNPIDTSEPIMGGDRLSFSGKMTRLKKEVEDPHAQRKMLFAVLALIVMLGLSLSGVLDLLTSAMIAALLMAATHCISIQSAFRSINWEIILTWVMSIALGEAFEKTGVAETIAESLVALSGTHPLTILFTISFIGTFFTEFVSNTAAAALLFPIVVSIVTPLGLPLLPFTIALMISVTCSFATPIGSPTHMLVYPAGGYNFSDFMKIGVPMNFIILVANVLSVYLLFF